MSVFLCYAFSNSTSSQVSFILAKVFSILASYRAWSQQSSTYSLNLCNFSSKIFYNFKCSLITKSVYNIYFNAFQCLSLIQSSLSWLTKGRNTIQAFISSFIPRKVLDFLSTFISFKLFISFLTSSSHSEDWTSNQVVARYSSKVFIHT